MPKIDLGKSLKDSISIHALDPAEDRYPTLFLSDVEDPALAGLPDKGECVIKYRVISRTHREEKGKKDCCDLRLEILSIDPPPVKSKKRNGDSDGGARKAFSEYFKDK